MLRILPSIASADPLNLRQALCRIQGIGRVHVDIEDGNFVNNITFGLKTLSAISRIFNGAVDVHLMTANPESYLEPLSKLPISAVCGHIEALPYPKRFLLRARALGMKAGLAFNLKASPEEILSYRDCLDYILIMTSEPDDGEQSFFPSVFQRVSHFRQLALPNTSIWCDGGIQPVHLKKLCDCGMDTAVMGRAVFSSDDPEATILSLERSIVNL